MKKLIYILFVILFVYTAPAGLTYSFDMVTHNTPGLELQSTQFTMTIQAEQDSQLSFTFYNNGPLAGSITGIYFDGDTLFNYDHMVGLNSGVSFSQYATPQNLPGGNPFGFKSDRILSFDSDAPNVTENGLNMNESLGILVVLKADKLFGDVVNAIAAGIAEPSEVERLRVGIHVQSSGPGTEYSESFLLDAKTQTDTTGTPIPEPATLAILGLGMLFLKRTN